MKALRLISNGIQYEVRIGERGWGQKPKVQIELLNAY